MKVHQIIKENGFYFLNYKSTFYGKVEYIFISIFFSGGFIVFEMTPVPGRININEILFSSKMKNRKKFEKFIADGKYLSHWTPNTEIAKYLSVYEINNNEIVANFLGEGFVDYNNIKLTIYNGGFWLKNNVYIKIDFPDINRRFLSDEKIAFYQYP